MQNITPFAPKIIERTLFETNVYDSIEDYYSLRKVNNIAKKASSTCSLCGKTKPNKAHNNSLHKQNRYSIDNENNIFSLNTFYLNSKPNCTNHNYIHTASVTNELGDDLKLYESKDSAYNYNYFEAWLNSSISPDYRGIGIRERGESKYYSKLKHTPLFIIDSRRYRRTGLASEISKLIESSVDHLSPKVRGKRSSSTLKEAIYRACIHKERSWKSTKARKQWLVKLK